MRRATMGIKKSVYEGINRGRALYASSIIPSSVDLNLDSYPAKNKPYTAPTLASKKS